MAEEVPVMGFLDDQATGLVVNEVHAEQIIRLLEAILAELKKQGEESDVRRAQG